MSRSSYMIRGGHPGRERLRVLARVMRPATLSLLDRLGLRPGLRCLDVGCGGGDVTAELAQRVGPDGSALGIDIDEIKLEIARAEAAAAGIANLTFDRRDILTADLPTERFELIYARFLLTHLPDPARVVARMRDLLVPGGLLVVEDIDFSGHFVHPPSEAFAAYLDLYGRAARLRGADPDIGPRLPGLLRDAGLADVQMVVAQPAGFHGEVKLVAALTMEAIANSVLSAGLATIEQIDGVIAELHRLAQDDITVMSIVRVVQAWGSSPAAHPPDIDLPHRRSYIRHSRNSRVSAKA